MLGGGRRERIVDMGKTLGRRDPAAGEQRQLSRASRQFGQAVVAFASGEVADRVHPGVNIERAQRLIASGVVAMLRAPCPTQE